MTAPDPAWVEAVADAFIEKMWIHRNDRESAVEMGEEAVAALEPLIREQIAAQIADEPRVSPSSQWARRYTPGEAWNEALDLAARIARGES